MTAPSPRPAAAEAAAEPTLDAALDSAQVPGPARPEPAETGIAHPWAAPPAEGQAIEVAEGVLWMRLPLPMRLDHVNVYALRDADGWTVVDAGFDSARSRAVWAALKDGPLAGAPIRRVLATHQHPDHIGLAGWFMEEGAELLTSRTAWLMARMLALDVQERPTPAQVAYWRRAGMPAEMLDRKAAERPWNTADVVHPLPLGYTRLRDGDRLRLGGRDWRVWTGNGHAAEHLTLWSEDDDLVIAGDQLLPGISPNLGVYATEPGANPVAEWLESCDRFAALAEDRHLVLPGHKLPYTGLPARLVQLAENHRTALDRLAASLAERPRTAADCFDLLYRRRIGEGEYGLALAEAIAHVNALAAAGRIRVVGETGTGGVIWGAPADR